VAGDGGAVTVPARLDRSADRRIIGLLVVGLAVTAVLAIAGLQRHTVSGTAALARVPGAPHLGQCLLQAPPDRGGAGAGQSYRLGSCTTPHYGEVAQVSGVTGPVDTGASCADPAEFLGWSPPVSATPVRWGPIDVNVLEMNPTALQRAFGQHWVVCVVTPVISGSAYNGSVRGVLATGRVPVAFAECTAGLYVLTGSVPCNQPHPYELFANAELPVSFTDQSGLDADCRAIAASATRLPDLTAGGELDVRAVPFHQNADGATVTGLPDGPSDVGAQAVCLIGVTGERLLRGSLFGLGTAPLPWA
jgi:hypothetical protein